MMRAFWGAAAAAMLAVTGCGATAAGPQAASPPAPKASGGDAREGACDGGDHEACAALGYAYEYGNGVTKNLPVAAQFDQKACDGGSMKGCDQLASLYLAGDGVPQDAAKADALYHKACDGGYADACFSIAEQANVEIHNLLTVEQTKIAADETLDEAAREAAQKRLLATLCADNKKVIDYLKKACDLKSEDACKGMASGEDEIVHLPWDKDPREECSEAAASP